MFPIRLGYRCDPGPRPNKERARIVADPSGHRRGVTEAAFDFRHPKRLEAEASDRFQSERDAIEAGAKRLYEFAHGIATAETSSQAEKIAARTMIDWLSKYVAPGVMTSAAIEVEEDAVEATIQ